MEEEKEEEGVRKGNKWELKVVHNSHKDLTQEKKVCSNEHFYF